MNVTAQRVEYLRQAIRRHDHLYYVEARPEIGDADYDALYQELEEIERAHPEWITPDSPTQRVGGAPLSAFAPVFHDPPMMSLDKTHARGDLQDFDVFLRRRLPAETMEYVVEPKVDGVAFAIRYEHRCLARAASRGNGAVGDDITANVRTIRSIPLVLPDEAPEVLEVRGEIFMSRAGFAALNQREIEAGHEPFMNPRNAAAGSLRQLEPREVARRPLDAILYAVGAVQGVELATHCELLQHLAAWGFKIPPWHRLCADMPTTFSALDELERMRHDFPFEIDGAVIKVNQRGLYERLGVTARAPRWARAFKFEPERAETRINAITVQVGRTGVLTPVAELEPVLLSGSEIARATLHNADEIARKDIRIGDSVWLVKAGDVIPAIESVLIEKRSGTERVFTMPRTCPECDEGVLRREGEVAWRCVNPLCPAQLIGRLEHFAARDALDIRGLGGKIAEQMVSAQLVADSLDLFKLSEDDLKPIFVKDADPRKRSKAARNMVEAIEAARGLPLNRWLFATGIPNIGVTVSEQVADAHQDFEELASSAILPLVARLAELEGRARKSDPGFDLVCREIAEIGESLVARGLAERKAGTAPPPEYICVIKPEAARALLQFFESEYGRTYLVRLRELGINPRGGAGEAGKGEAPLSGLAFVLTGVFSEKRSALAVRIKAAGGVVQDTVSRKTDYLVAGGNTGATKTSRARALGIAVLDEDGLNKLFETASTASSSDPATEEAKVTGEGEGCPDID